MLTRRQFVWTSLAAAAAPSLLPRRAMALAPRRQFPEVPLVSTKVHENVFAITERGGNSLLIITADGPILVDTKICGAAHLLAAEAKKVAGGAAPKVVINTHHHFDHSGGNFAFDDSAEIVAHRNLNPRMQANLDTMLKPALSTEINALRTAGKIKEAEAMAAWADTITVDDIKADQEYDETMTIDRGGVKVVLTHFGNGHTDNDTVVFLPEANVLHMGDLFFNNMHPFIDRPAGANTVGWRDSVRKSIALCNDKTIVIPGHGEITDSKSLARQIEYFDQLHKIVEAAIKDGKSKATIGAMQPEAFKGYGFEQLREQALTNMYDELTVAMN